ncbi:ribosomal protein S19 binding protein 1 [Erpetoichthys calabaricus]|uniref:Active regulator of SIRT1 n=1 Tax=Erpetoichthys calabaricus TaxID=27687 RepID=A0A8C4T3G3_ERPCA|nr:ribosomal protein S19 binding protein 1 [Erpetoichthys calabaricus]
MRDSCASLGFYPDKVTRSSQNLSVGFTEMSASLIRKGLDLFSDDIKDETKTERQKKKKKAGAEVMEQISSNRIGVKRQVRRIRGMVGKKKNQATVKSKVVKSAVEEYKKRANNSHLEKNLKYMLYTRFSPDCSITEKVIHQNYGRKSRDQPSQKKENKSEKSIFTEADFQHFQKDYFGRQVERK